MSASRELVDGRYEIVRPLGRGGMGEVLLARQLNLDRLVVLKRAVDARADSEREALAAEARVVARLHHPNIVSIIDVVDRDVDPVVVMELVVGVSLRELLEHTPDGLPVEVALAIASDVLRGLVYAHGVRSADLVGVVHRDVNPRNVMVTFAGITKLIDFGISRWLDHRDAPTSISGTKGYMAPEQQRGEPVDGRADQFAVGVTLGEMLAERDAALAAIIAHACEERRDDRFASCAAMLDAIEDYQATRGIAATATHVERWTLQHFTHRRDRIEQDAAAASPRLRTRHPTAQTIVAHGSRRGKRIAFTARNVGAARDAWLAPAIERTAWRVLRDGERRFAVASRPDPDAIHVELAFVRDTAIDITAYRDGAPLASATAPSVVEAIDVLADALVAQLGSALATRGPDSNELAQLRQLGAGSFETYLRYRTLVERYYSTSFADGPALATLARELVAAEPKWAHAYALLVMLEGRATPAALAALADGLARADATRDPAGAQMLQAYDALARNDLDRAYALFAAAATGSDDVLATSCVVLMVVALQRTDEATALSRKLHSDHPDLAFGVDLVDAFRRSGREAAAELAIRDWIAAAPDNVPARVELVRSEAALGRIDTAAALARDVLVLHGERGDTAGDLFEAAIASEQFDVAERLADRMLTGSSLTRARGRFRIAIAAVFDGRFAAAFDSIRRAIDEHRGFALQSELVQCLELARSVAPLVGDTAAQRAFTVELAEAMETLVGDVAAAAATRYELALLDRRGVAPAIDTYLAGLDDAALRDVARRRMLRSAAVADCGSPHKAVAAGFSAFEENAASLLALGLCAIKLPELELARRSLERATRTWSALTTQGSPYHAVLARFHLAGVRAEVGDIAGARAMYESFLRCWGNADRPIAEVAIARQMLAHLGS